MHLTFTLVLFYASLLSVAGLLAVLIQRRRYRFPYYPGKTIVQNHGRIVETGIGTNPGEEFLLEARPDHGLIRVLCRGAPVEHWMHFANQELKKGDRITLFGFWVDAMRQENLYRQRGQQRALEAVQIIRGSPLGARWIPAMAALLILFCTLALLQFYTRGLRSLVDFTAETIRCPEDSIMESQPSFEPPDGGWIHRCISAEGKPHGPWGKWRASGQQTAGGTYINGERHGYWWEQRFVDGRQDSGDYYRGKRHGNWSLWSEDGAFKVIADYQQGVLHGQWRRYDRMGFLWEQGDFENGQRSGSWEFNHPKDPYHWSPCSSFFEQFCLTWTDLNLPPAVKREIRHLGVLKQRCEYSRGMPAQVMLLLEAPLGGSSKSYLYTLTTKERQILKASGDNWRQDTRWYDAFKSSRATNNNL